MKSYWCVTKQHKTKKVLGSCKEDAAKQYMAYLGPWQSDTNIVVAVDVGGVGAAVYRSPTYLRVTFQCFEIYVTRIATFEEF